MKNWRAILVIASTTALLISGLLAELGWPAEPTLNIAPVPKIVKAGAYQYSPSSVTGSATWVAECLTIDTIKGDASRSNSWHVDETLPKAWRARSEDYAGSTYDLGHLAPAHDYGHQKDQDASFNMSNVVPQNSALNRGLWAKIERHVVGVLDDDSRGDKRVFVVTLGTYHYEAEQKIPRAGRVFVPSHISKAVYIEKAGKPQSCMAWRCPNCDPKNNAVPNPHDPDSYRVTVREVEEDSQLDLFSWLPIEVQNKLENQK